MKQETKQKRMAAGSSSEKKPKREHAETEHSQAGGSLMHIERRIKHELIDDALPMEFNNGSGLASDSLGSRQRKGKGQASVPLTQSQQLEQLAIRLPKPKKPRLDPS
jgi:hypothetical protein